MTNSLLFVPVRLDGLAIQSDFYVVGPLADFSRLPRRDGNQEVHSDTVYLSEAILSHPYRDRDLPLRPGVHLHWSLPDGAHQDDGPADRSPADVLFAARSEPGRQGVGSISVRGDG